MNAITTTLRRPSIATDAETVGSNDTCEVAVVMPCLNEADTLATCIAKAQGVMAEHGIVGEVIVADNGSTDESVQSQNCWALASSQ